MMEVLRACVNPDPSKRLSASDILKLPYFHEVQDLISGTPLQRAYDEAYAVAAAGLLSSSEEGFCGGGGGGGVAAASAASLFESSSACLQKRANERFMERVNMASSGIKVHPGGGLPNPASPKHLGEGSDGIRSL